MKDLDYYQYSYVTTDWRRAMDELAEQHDIGGWFEMPDAVFDTGPGKTAVCHFALANKNGLQIEVIQPISGDCSVYRIGLPESGYAKRFHHLGRHFSNRADFDRHYAAAKARYTLPVAAETMGGEYAYFDARQDTGHFLELYIFPADSHLSQVPNW
ncbi:VOC family protein [Sphingobium sp. DEHP117]|uniref:VOC family protein n=1 Tax=Sphingobium sp. DEHP117 TaxID=2993436 RepID=UPI0027D50D2A|nr:VOC family protein [Sphingobium sp. DEHP117]MDQ4420343.1 VOC family protein [Sphingobium sp. DEHP117]